MAKARSSWASCSSGAATCPARRRPFGAARHGATEKLDRASATCSADNGDIDGAKAAYERAIAAGSTDARLNLGLMLAHVGAPDEALAHLRAAEESGDPVASWAIGKILEGREDLQGAATAYRRSADGGNAHEMMDAEAPAQASADTGAKWAQLYVAACGEVLAAANACLEKANQAVGARNMAANRPQHEISIRNFTTYAENAEREFAPLYGTFEAACAAARDTAAQLLASQSDPLYAETVLAVGVEESVLDNVAIVKGLLGATSGPSPAAFLQGVDEANGLMQNPPDAGNIYRPLAAARSGERACPWCAETIKAAAVICRFCGRDVQIQPNVG